MAFTEQQLAALADFFNIEGEEPIIDVEGDIEAQLRAQFVSPDGTPLLAEDGDFQEELNGFLSGRIEYYETALVELTPFLNTLSPYNPILLNGPETSVDGEWDVTTGMRLIESAGIAADTFSQTTLEGALGRIQLDIQALEENEEIEASERNAAIAELEETSRNITALASLNPAEIQFLIGISDTINETDTFAAYQTVLNQQRVLEIDSIARLGIFGALPEFSAEEAGSNIENEQFRAVENAIFERLSGANETQRAAVFANIDAVLTEYVIPTLNEDQAALVSQAETLEQRLIVLSSLPIQNEGAAVAFQTAVYADNIMQDPRILLTPTEYASLQEAAAAAEAAAETDPTPEGASGPETGAVEEPESAAAAEETETPQPPPVDPRTQLPAMNEVSLVEMAFIRTFANSRLLQNQQDGFYDIDVQNFVYDHVETLLNDYIHEDYLVTAASGTQYFIGGDGAIYATEGEGDNLTKGDRIGSVLDGLRNRDDERTRPHEASVAFTAALYEQMQTGAIASLGTGIAAEDLAEIEQLNATKEELYSSFFMQSPELTELQDEFETMIRESRGLDLERFQQSDLARRIRNAAGSDADVDAFIIAAFRTENQLNSYGEAYTEFDLQRDTTGIIANFVEYMATDQTYDPNALDTVLSGTNAANDLILAPDAYQMLEFVRGGDHVLVSSLYDERNTAQAQSIHMAFGDRQSVTREEVYEYVQRQVNLRAIEQLDPDVSATDIAALQTVAEQDAFIAQNAATLQGVSQAMFEGRFNPYEGDMHLAFRAAPRPDLTHPGVVNTINFHRENGNIPTAEYALNTMNDAALREITGREDFTTLDRNAQIEILNDVMARPISDFTDNASYERMMLNYYEEIACHYTFDRNEAWNEMYGEMNRDQLMMTYLMQNWGRHEQLFGDAAGSFFLTGQRAYMNYNLTYEEATANMTPQQIATLDAGIESVSETSMYQHLLQGRLGFYRDQRTDEYIPRREEELYLARNFEGAANGQTEEAEEAPAEEATVEVTPDEVEETPQVAPAPGD